MKRGMRRWLFWTLLAAYAGGSLWWLVSVPPNPEAVLRAIPGQATIVSYHEDLAARWDIIAEHPVVMMLVGATGGDVEEWLDLKEDPGFKYIRDLAGKNQLALGYVPHLNNGESAWVFASWIGGQSQRLRWQQGLIEIPGLTSLGTIASWPVWSWTIDNGDAGQKLTLALVEGMLVGTTAKDPQAMHYILDAYNGNFPSIFRRRQLNTWNQQLITSKFPDRGWYKMQSGWEEPAFWFVECDLADSNTLRGAVATMAPAEWTPLPASLNLEHLTRFWGDKPIATAAFNPFLFESSFDQAFGDIGTLIKDVLRESGAKAAIAGLFGEPYTGLFKVIKVPTLMIALPLQPGIKPDTLINKITDAWNADYRLGLVPVQSTVSNHVLWRIEGTAGGFYGLIPASDQIAVTTSGDWLIISSNYAGLEAVVRAQGEGDAGELAWMDQMNDIAESGGIGYLGFDLERGAHVIHTSIKAYAGKLAFEDFSGTREQRQRLNEARAWVDTLARLNRLQIFASQANDQLKININASP